MIYGYARVSTKGQATKGNSLEEQEQQLYAHGAEKIFKDSFTGTKMNRPQFDKLRHSLAPGDTLMVTKLDRVARSAIQGAALVQELISQGITVHVLNMGVMDNSPTGKLIMTVMFAFAEFERDMIVQRTSEGKEIAKQREGYREGRPKKEIDSRTFNELVSKQNAGLFTVEECCAMLGICKKTWYNTLRNAN